MAVPNLRGYAQRPCWLCPRDPVHVGCGEARSLELGARADNDSFFGRPQLQDVQRLRGSDAQALALSYSEAMHAAMPADDLARLADDRAAGVEIPGLALDEGCVISIGNETDFLAVRFVGNRESEPARDVAYRILRQVADWEARVR